MLYSNYVFVISLQSCEDKEGGLAYFAFMEEGPSESI